MSSLVQQSCGCRRKRGYHELPWLRLPVKDALMCCRKKKPVIGQALTQESIHTHSPTHACTDTNSHTHEVIQAHTFMYTHIHTRGYTLRYAHTHTRIHTHICTPTQEVCTCSGHFSAGLKAQCVTALPERRHKLFGVKKTRHGVFLDVYLPGEKRGGDLLCFRSDRRRKRWNKW